MKAITALKRVRFFVYWKNHYICDDNRNILILQPPSSIISDLTGNTGSISITVVDNDITVSLPEKGSSGQLLFIFGGQRAQVEKMTEEEVRDGE